jgi:hypothetical protein
VSSHALAADAPQRADGQVVDVHSRPTLVFLYSPTSGGSRRVEGFSLKSCNADTTTRPSHFAASTTKHDTTLPPVSA